ncbi:hypothetical protein AVEN_105652-1 [Araneus ventricosus]|uniref:Uncharacterized protein n=1 Tax=Araneus ventricosus TaxID=182803 RepID=A0A4Y2QW85_ARAVE|nr:hypothetical protein AVEN_105652-1 [Araneus ventricosus]
MPGTGTFGDKAVLGDNRTSCLKTGHLVTQKAVLEGQQDKLPENGHLVTRCYAWDNRTRCLNRDDLVTKAVLRDNRTSYEKTGHLSDQSCARKGTTGQSCPENRTFGDPRLCLEQQSNFRKQDI